MKSKVRTRSLVYGAVVIAWLGPVASVGGEVLGESQSFIALRQSEPGNWLKEGSIRRQEGDYTGAGEAYARALDALSETAQRSEMGAKAAVDSADSYWSAFEADHDLAHLRAGIQILNRWLGFAGADDQTSRRPQVERLLKELQAIALPLERMKMALAEGRLEQARHNYGVALTGLTARHSPWPATAWVAVEIAEAHITTYDETVRKSADFEARRQMLEIARSVLEERATARPSDDESNEGQTIERLLVDIEARLEEADRQLVEQVVGRAEEDARYFEQYQAATRVRPERATREEVQAARLRRQSVVMLTLGVIGAVVGASSLGISVSLNAKARRTSRVEEAEAHLLEQDSGDFDRQAFDASIREYERQVLVRTTTGIVVGSTVLAGSLAAGAVGMVRIGSSQAPGHPRLGSGSSLAALSAGVAGLAAGAGLLSDGITFDAEVQQLIQEEEAEARQLAESFGSGFDHESFEASVREYEDHARVRVTAEVVSGSVLIATGTAASVVGIVGLARSRRHHGPAGRAWLVPAVSRSQVGFSLSTRF